MIYLHSFWSQPKRGAAGEDKDIGLQDFEAMTWLVSALQARRHGRIRMLTDARGLRFLQRTGLEWIYNGGVSTALDNTPADIHPKVFWTAGRMFAFALMDEPFASMDTDAILWQPLAATGQVLALHHEDRRWVSCASNRADFERFGFTGPGWNWRLQPVNLGVVAFPSPTVASSATAAPSTAIKSSPLGPRRSRASARPPAASASSSWSERLPAPPASKPVTPW